MNQTITDYREYFGQAVIERFRLVYRGQKTDGPGTSLRTGRVKKSQIIHQALYSVC
jgi:hypothetical protein